MQEWGVGLILWLQDVADPLVGSARLISDATQGLVLTSALVALWLWHRRSAVPRQALSALGLAIVAGGALKMAIAAPRPSWIDPSVIAHASESSFALPSGHAAMTMAVAGTLWWYERRTWARVALAVGVVAVGFARLLLGVHWPADVLFGWALGLAMAFVAVRFGQQIADLDDASLPLATGLVIAACFLGLALLVNRTQTGPLPADWKIVADENPRSLTDPVLGAMLFGAGWIGLARPTEPTARASGQQ